MATTGGPSIDEHFQGMDPDLVERIRAAAAEVAAAAPPPTKAQIKALRAIFKMPAPESSRGAA